MTTSAPSACTANIRHDRTASPSTRTVQAPHTPCSHPRCVPVRPRSSRSTSASVLRGSTVTRRAAPLTVIDDRVDRRRLIGVRSSSSMIAVASSTARRQASATIAVADPPAVAGRHLRVVGDVVDRRRTPIGRPRPGRSSADRRPASAASVAAARDRRARHAEHGDRAARDDVGVVELDGGDGTGDGEVAVAPGELGHAEPAAAAPHREGDRPQQLVVLQRRRPARR